MKPIEAIVRAAEVAAPGPNLTFTETHVLKAIEIMGEFGSAGRIRLARDLDIGEGAARTMIRHLRAAGIIRNDKIGCILTSFGNDIYRYIRSKLRGPVEVLKNPITLGDYNIAVLVKGGVKAVRYGLEQRDAAIKLGASGATTLLFTRNSLSMPSVKGGHLKASSEVAETLITNLKPHNGDAIIIGSASTENLAELSAKAAAIETLKQLEG